MAPSLLRRLLPVLLLGCAACADEELLHGLDERQANEVLVALDEAGLPGGRRATEGSEGGWTVTVPGRDADRARRVLAERELPRPRPPGFGDVFGEGGMVPTPVEEHARYLHALSGELARSLESLEGVVGARVHLGLAPDDPLRPGERRPPRAAVLVRCRPAACAAVRGMETGIRSLIAGAADGLVADSVSVLVAEAGAAAPTRQGPRRSPAWRAVAAGALVAAAGLLAVLSLRRPLLDRLRRRPGA